MALRRHKCHSREGGNPVRRQHRMPLRRHKCHSREGGNPVRRQHRMPLRRHKCHSREGGNLARRQHRMPLRRHKCHSREGGNPVRRQHRMTDEQVWNYALEEGCTILTKDSDFYYKCMRSLVSPKIIQFRLGNMTLKQLHAYFSQHWEALMQQIEQATLVLAERDKLTILL
jgi:predicted nuclease of predicted toxin-antitoxin system